MDDAIVKLIATVQTSPLVSALWTLFALVSFRIIPILFEPFLALYVEHIKAIKKRTDNDCAALRIEHKNLQELFANSQRARDYEQKLAHDRISELETVVYQLRMDIYKLQTDILERRKTMDLANRFPD